MAALFKTPTGALGSTLKVQNFNTPEPTLQLKPACPLISKGSMGLELSFQGLGASQPCFFQGGIALHHALGLFFAREWPTNQDEIRFVALGVSGEQDLRTLKSWVFGFELNDLRLRGHGRQLKHPGLLGQGVDPFILAHGFVG